MEIKSIKKEWNATILDILKAFMEICKTHNLRYYCCAGTAIGAARHHGMIPWDDDIDVLMPRPDYDRLLEIAKKEDFTFETVLSSEYKLNILRKAKEEGYFIKCVFMLTVDPQINIARIESRVAAGGHNVDSSKVIERYYKSINNIKELLDICDIMHVYDNTKSPERIIRKHKEELSIYPNEY